MFIELHILQSFAPSNLNRDDTNSPKQCDFGGYRRARVSSQCWKRAMRTYFESSDLLPEEGRSMRTKRLVEKKLVPRLTAAGKNVEEAAAVAWAALGAIKIEADKKAPEKTQYLLFLGEREAEAIGRVCLDHWGALLAAGTEGETGAEGKKKKKGVEVAPEVGKAMAAAIDGGRAASVALFGRMLADAPDLNIDAAAQVAHAISTHAVEVEFDFYTAVDDLKPDDTAGADMMGTVEFNSACFYRYLNVDTTQLEKNLQGDSELARLALAGFLEGAVKAIPTGKQNSMAAHNPPSVILAVAGSGSPRNLANAFIDPVFAFRGHDLITASAKKLLDTRADLGRMFGTDKEAGAWVCATEDVDLATSGAATAPALRDLVASVLDATSPRGEAVPA